MVKRIESSFNLWRRAIPRLRATFKTLDSIRAKIPDEDIAAQLALIDYDLKANREVRETLRSEIAVRREVAELRKVEYDGLGESEIEEILIRTAQRRGYRSVDLIRKHAVGYLVSRGASPDAAQLLVDEVIPPVKSEKKRKPLESYVRAHFNELESELDEGIREVEELLTSRSITESSETGPAHEGSITTSQITESHPDEPKGHGG